MLSLRLLFRLLFLSIALLAAPLRLAAQNASELRGQVTDAGSGLPIEGAVVTLDMNTPDGAPEYSATTGPFGFYTISGIATGDYTAKATHRVFNDKTAPDPLIVGIGQNLKQNFRLTLRAEIPSVDSFFDIYVQVNGAVSGWGLTGCPVVIERFENMGDPSPADSFLLFTDENGAAVLNGAEEGFYRFVINDHETPGSRDKWEEFTTEGKAEDKKLIAQAHMAQLYLKPVEQTMTFQVFSDTDLIDTFNFDPVLMNGVYVTLEGFDPNDPDIQVIPPRTGVTDENGQVTFKGLPGVSYVVTPKRLGYTGIEEFIDPDPEGALPTGLQTLSLEYQDRSLKVNYVHDYDENFHAAFVGNKLVGIKGTNTEGIERTFFDIFPDGTATYQLLLPGRYQVVATGETFAEVEMLTATGQMLYESFAAQGVGEIVVEISGLGQTMVDMPVEFKPVKVRGRLMAADRTAEPVQPPQFQPAYLPLANKTVRFKEKEGVDILPDDMKEVVVTTDASGAFSTTILPGVYGILVDGMDDYWGEAVIETPIASSSGLVAGTLGEADRNVWPMWQQWPHANLDEFSIDQVFDPTGMPIGAHDVTELDLLLRKDVTYVNMPINIVSESPIISDPTLFLVPGFDGEQPLISVGYRDIEENGTPTITRDGDNLMIDGMMSEENNFGYVVAKWTDVPPGDYQFSVSHPRFVTTPPEPISVFDYPAPGMAPVDPYDDYPVTGDNSFSVPLGRITTEVVESTFPDIGEAKIGVRYWNDDEGEYGEVLDLNVNYITVGYLPGVYMTAGGAPSSGWVQGWVNLNGGWINVTPSSIVKTGDGNDDTTPTGFASITTNFSVEARLKQDPTKTVDGVNFQIDDGGGINRTTPYANASFSNTPYLTQPFGLDNWIWEDFSPKPVVTLSGGINIKQTIVVDQGMEVVVTLRNATTLSVLPNVPVELLASNGVPLRSVSTLAGKQEFLTDETGKVTFNSVPGYRDYFLSVEAPGFKPVLHRLNAADATEVMDDPSTNFRHTVTLDLELLTPPNITTTGVPIDRWGAFLPGVNKTGGQDAFQLTAEETLTATWSVRFGRQTHIYQLPGFDQPDGSMGDTRDITMDDDIVEAWLVDQRVFEGDFYSNNPNSLNLPPATDPIGVAQVLAGFFKQPNFDETKKFTYFSRTTDIQAFDEEFGLYEASGKIKLWKLPPGEFDPIIIVIAKSGAVALYDVPYTDDDDGKQLLGVPIPPWLSFAFDIIGFAGGVSTTQDEIKKYVPDGKFIPFPEFSAEIKRHKDDNDDDTNYIDYEYKITLLQKEGQDMPGRDLTGLAAGILGGEFKSEAAITMPGMDKKLALSIESSISNEDISLDNYAPKLAGGLEVEATLDKVGGSVKTENAVNIDPDAPWEVRLENTVNFNLDASFKMNLEPVLGKIPYVGPVLTVLDKTGTLTFTAVTEAGAGLGTTFCWETLRPQDIDFGGTTTDPDPRVRRRHFLGGHEPDVPTGCTNAFDLCFRFGVGMDVAANLRIGSLEGSGRLLLTGPECAGQSALTIQPNTFGDWPPVKRIAGEAKAEIKGTLKTPIKNFSKEWSWSLLKFDAQYGTETIFQLIPMEITQEVIDLTIFPNPNFTGDTGSPDIVRNFLPVGSFDASPGGRVLFLGKDESTGDIRLLMARETGPFQYAAPIEIASAGAINKPQLLELPDGRVLIVWLQIDSADIDDVFAPAALMFSISDTSGSNFSGASLIASLNTIPQGMRLKQSGGLIALVLLQETGGSLQLSASSYSGSSWSAFESFGSPEEITAFDVAATGPDGPGEIHIHYIIGGNLRYYRWGGGAPASSQSISLGTVDPWTGTLSSQATPDGIYRVVGTRSSGLNYYSAPAPESSYSMASGFALDAQPTQFQSAYLDDDTDPVIVYIWTESTPNGVALRFAFTDSSGNTLTASQLLTGGGNGRYSAIRVVPLANGAARIFAVFTNVPRDGFSPLGVSEPNDSSELRTFLLSFDSGTSGNDTDGDGMDDTKELDIVDYDPDDFIASVADVLTDDDFDGDGFSNLAEIDMGADPTDPLSFPLLDGVIVNATEPVAHEYGALPGTITVQRPADDLSQPLSVLYNVAGSATPGDDYGALTSPIEIPIDSDSATLIVSPVADDLPEGDETVELTLQPDAAYVLAEPSSATVTIKDRPIDDWRWRNFPAIFDQPEAQDLSDFENDGVLNILEYALALDPGLPDTIGLPALSIYDNADDGRQYLMLTYTRAAEAGDLDYIVEVSGDLSTDSWLPGQVVDVSMGETDASGNDIIKVRDTVPLDDNGAIIRFMRLRVARTVEN